MAEVAKKHKFILNANYEQALDYCFQAAQKIRKSKLLDQDKLNNKLRFQTGTGFRSFGEIIEFSVNQISATQTEIEVSSRALVDFVYDWGKNKDNIAVLEKFFYSIPQTTKVNNVLASTPSVSDVENSKSNDSPSFVSNIFLSLNWFFGSSFLFLAILMFLFGNSEAQADRVAIMLFVMSILLLPPLKPYVYGFCRDEHVWKIKAGLLLATFLLFVFASTF